MNKLSNDLPNGITEDEVNGSCCELGDIVPDRTEDHDIVVVGAGASGYLLYQQI